MSGERHGYEIMQFLGSALGTTWRLSTSQLYVLLKRLEQEGLLDARAESQPSRPSKRVFDLTVKGRKTFLEWVDAPSNMSGIFVWNSCARCSFSSNFRSLGPRILSRSRSGL